MKKGTITSLLVVLAAVACMASADIALEVVPVDNSSQLTAYVTQDLVVTTDTDWWSAQLIVTLDAPGGIYQDAMGGQCQINPCFFGPTPAVIGLFPIVEFDTYVSNGVPGESVSVTGAVDLGGPPNEIFDVDHISILWYTTDTDEIGTLALARVTLADSANGTWQFLATAAPQGGPGVDVPAGVVENGVMYIPEPATLGMFALGGLALIRRKRK